MSDNPNGIERLFFCRGILDVDESAISELTERARNYPIKEDDSASLSSMGEFCEQRWNETRIETYKQGAIIFYRLYLKYWNERINDPEFVLITPTDALIDGIKKKIESLERK